MAFDPEKRRRIMTRSIKLGHCICNPKLPCPCETFKEKNVCLCAGERLEDTTDDIQLTHYVENAGCASKINQNDLKIALAGLPPLDDPRVSVLEEDVVETIRKTKSGWDAILLDVDNGPDGLTRKANDRLYSRSGLKTSFSALRPGGILAVWSSGANESFTRRLKQCGFRLESAPLQATGECLVCSGRPDGQNPSGVESGKGCLQT